MVHPSVPRSYTARSAELSFKPRDSSLVQTDWTPLEAAYKTPGAPDTHNVNTVLFDYRVTITQKSLHAACTVEIPPSHYAGGAVRRPAADSKDVEITFSCYSEPTITWTGEEDEAKQLPLFLNYKIFGRIRLTMPAKNLKNKGGVKADTMPKMILHRTILVTGGKIHDEEPLEPIVKLPTLPRGPGTTDAPPLEAEDDQGEGNEEQKKQLDNELRRDLEFLMAEESRLVDEKLAAATKAAIAQMLPQIEKEVEKEAQQELQEKRDLILAMWQEMREQSQPRIPQDLDAAMPTTPVADTQPDKRSRTVAIGDTPDQSRAKMRIYLDVLEIEDKREKALLAKSRALEDELMGVRRIKEHLLSLMQDAKHNI